MEPGSEVLLIEPFYDSYSPVVAMAGCPPARRAAGTRRPRLRHRYRRAAPRGHAADQGVDRQLTAQPDRDGGHRRRTGSDRRTSRCRADLLVITDEVYEHLVFDGHRHLPLATYPGMAERTVTISSAAKMFNCTGWKIGWACGAPELIAGVRAAKQYLSYVGGAPFQPAVAQALNTEEAWVAALRESLQAKRDRLGSALAELGFEVHDSFGTYFLCADPRPLGYGDSTDVLRRTARARRRGRDPDVGVLRSGRRARRRVESPGALRILQARRHPGRGDPQAGGVKVAERAATPKGLVGRRSPCAAG